MTMNDSRNEYRAERARGMAKFGVTSARFDSAAKGLIAELLDGESKAITPAMWIQAAREINSCWRRI